MLSSFGATLLELLDERDMGVPELVEELRPALERAGFDYGYTTEEVISAVSSPLAPCYVGMVVGIAEALDLDSEEYMALVRAVQLDARWGLVCDCEGWAD